MALASIAHTLDRARSPVLKILVARSRWLRNVLSSRNSRTEFYAVVAIVAALTMTLLAPGFLYLWAPLLIGVPHIVADLRYLALPPYARASHRLRDIVVVALLAMTIYSPTPRFGGAAIIAAMVLTPWSTRSLRTLATRVAVLAVAVAGYTWMCRNPITTSYVLLHGHNLVAIALFSLVFARGRVRWLLPLLVAVVCSVVLAGIADPLLRGMSVENLAGYLLPSSALDHWPHILCARIAVLFVFLQSVHYAVWLRLIPEQARVRKGMRSFSASLRALQNDFGTTLLLGFAALAMTLPLLGLHDATSARRWYLQLAGFHAYFELACVARWWTSRSVGTRG
jgi:hypothetical protein